MLFIFASTLLFAVLLARWGGLCVGCLRFETDTPWLYPFLGMFAAGTAFTAASLWLPLNSGALAVFALAGLGGLPWWARALRQWRSGHCAASGLVFWTLALGCTAALAAYGAIEYWPASARDTNAYHATAVRWLNEYGSPPGLANLYGNLGNNSAWLTLAALFDNVCWDARSAWIMSVLLFFCTAAYLLHNVLFAPERPARLFCGVMFIFVLYMKQRLYFPNLYYDLPSLWIAMAVFMECLAQAARGWGMTPGRAAVILSLAALSFSMKPLSAITLLFASAAVLYGLKKNRNFSLRQVCRAFVPAAAAGMVWVTRNSILSGYPLFPLPVLPLPLDWTLPGENVVGVYEAVVGYARSPGPDYWMSAHGWNWLVPWLQRNSGQVTLWISAWLPLLAAMPLWGKVLCRGKNATPLFFGAWCVLCLIYWFFSAPAVRFGSAFFQMFFALGLAFALQPAPWLSIWERRCAAFLQNMRLCGLASALFLLVALSASVWVLTKDAQRSFFHIEGIPAGRLLSRELDASVTPPILLFFPESGSLCQNSPLPCTGYNNPRLRLRVPGELGGGFYIE